MKKIVLLGSTGSIGTQTLDVVRRHSDKFQIIGMACNSNIDLFEKQVLEFKPKYVVISDSNAKEKFALKDKVICLDNIVELTDVENDIVLNAVVGIAGLKPTLNVLKNNGTLALANKESLVTGGEFINNNKAIYKGQILPVDSEHSAIFQCLHYNKYDKEINKLILTASGGAFRDLSYEQLKNVKVQDALKHPNWDMGAKVTIDCATLMNKGLEVLEAMYLYDLPVDKVDVIIHKQSIIHSMVEFIDSSVLAQISYPTMTIPIQLALSYPNRIESDVPKMDFAKVAMLNFEKPNYELFPCLKIALNCAKDGGIMPIIMNGANEVLVDYFRKGIIGFLDIPKYLEMVLSKLENKKISNIDEIFNIDKVARQYTINEVNFRGSK